MSLEVRPLSYALGAEIIGVDIRKPLSGADLQLVRTAFLDHCVLLFRKQPLTREQHVEFSRQFGDLEANDEAARIRNSDFPEIVFVNNVPQPDGKLYKVGEQWHTDLSFTLAPAAASLLRTVDIPPVGGDTMFANMYTAYDTLSEGMKTLLEGLHGIHAGGARGRVDHSTAERQERTQRLNQSAQPIVRVHPETGRKALYIAEKVKQIVGMTEEESKPILQFLCKHATRPQFIYRHVWQKDDLIMWDNRCLMHIAVADHGKNYYRLMERTTVKGTPSGYAYEG